MSKLTPKGTRYNVNETNHGREREEIPSQLSGSRLVYGIRNNLYKPILTDSLDPKELAPLREQMIRWGVPIGVELELEFMARSPLQAMSFNQRMAQYSRICYAFNQKVAAFQSEYSQSKGWETYRYKPMVTAKGDGSLTSPGYEFVVAPITPDYARKTGIYGAMSELHPELGFLGHSGPNTGAHMHMPLGVFSDPQLILYYKLIEFLADARAQRDGNPGAYNNARFIQIIGARKLGHWARWYRMGTVGDYGRILNGDRGRANLSSSRMYIVERSRHGTIEHRFPKGTYNAERVIMRTSFLNVMYLYTYVLEQESYNDPAAFYDIYNMDRFLGFIHAMGGIYPELARYVRRNWPGLGYVTSTSKDNTVHDDMLDWEAYLGNSQTVKCVQTTEVRRSY